MSVCVPTFRDVECKYTRNGAADHQGQGHENCHRTPRPRSGRRPAGVPDRARRTPTSAAAAARSASASRRRCRAAATSSIACRWSVWSKRTASNATASRRPPSARCATCTVRIARSTCVVRCRPEEPRPHRVRLRSEKVTRKVTYCEMVPYQETIRVPVCPPVSCDSGWPRPRLRRIPQPRLLPLINVENNGLPFRARVFPQQFRVHVNARRQAVFCGR